MGKACCSNPVAFDLFLLVTTLCVVTLIRTLCVLKDAAERRRIYNFVEDGKSINVDEWMNQTLDDAIAKYEEKTIEMTQTVSRQYFEVLAERFSLKLKLEFISP